MHTWSKSDMLGLAHWGRATHICVNKLTIIGSDNGLSPERRQAIIWTNGGILLIGPLGTTFGEILIEIQTFSLKIIRLKMSSAKFRQFCLGLNVLMPKITKFHITQTFVSYIFICCVCAWYHQRLIDITISNRDWNHSPPLLFWRYIAKKIHIVKLYLPVFDMRTLRLSEDLSYQTVYVILKLWLSTKLLVDYLKDHSHASRFRWLSNSRYFPYPPRLYQCHCRNSNIAK